MFLTLVIKQLPNAVHPWFFSFKIFTLIFCFPINLILFGLLILSFPKPAVAKSLAIPLTPKQSGLFGVIDKSIKLEVLLLKYFFPILFLNLVEINSIMPSLSSD